MSKLSIPSREAGFSRVDLAAMLASATLVCLLLLTTAGVDRQGATTVTCRANLRQLVRAWSLYVQDNGDRLPANNGDVAAHDWCGGGFLNFTASPQNWNVRLLTNGTLWPYAANAEAWHCPADTSTVRAAGQGELRRIRSYSMNASMGTVIASWAPRHRTFLKITDLTTPGPAKTFALLDEHPDSINDGLLAMSMDGFEGSAAQRRWVDYPGSHHLGACNLAFADGHLETWKWRDSRTMPPVRNLGILPLNVPSPNNPDVARLQAVTTSKR